MSHYVAAQRVPGAETVLPPGESLEPVLEMRADIITTAVRNFASAFPGVRPLFATKCNPDPGVLRVLRAAGCGFEVASVAEMALLAGLGAHASELMFSNPVRARIETATAFASGIRRFAVDSAEELKRIAELAPGSEVFVRLATDPEGSLVPSEGKFGADPRLAVYLCLKARRLGLQPRGLTFHMGSQSLSPDALAVPLDDVRWVMTRLAAEDVRIAVVNIGGGFPARYSSDVPALAAFGRVFQLKRRELPYPVDVVAEPGRCLVAAAGTFRCRVIGVAERRGVAWAHTNLGVLNGMMEVLESGGTMRYPMRDSRRSQSQRTYHVTGPTCDSQDTFATNVRLSADLRAGDEIEVGSAGAYTTTYATAFHGFPPPRVVVI